MRYLIIYLLSLSAFLSNAQNCSVCPSGTSVQLTSTFSATAAHQWSCTNGFTSTLRNPTFTPLVDCSCTVVATENGCVATSTTTVDLCDCSCNTACVGGSHNQSTDCVTVSGIGTSCTTAATDVFDWKKSTSSTWTGIANNGTVCGCNIYEQILVTPTCDFFSGTFRFGYNATICAGSTINNAYWLPYVGTTSTIITSSTNTYISLSTTDIINGGGGGHLIIRNVTPLGTILAKIQFNYDGSGTACTDITSTVIQQSKAYYDINLRRTQTFTGGCPNNVCTSTLDIPNQPDDCLLDGYVTTVNLSTPCSGSGLSASSFFGTAPYSYQWTYNGANISGATGVNHCLVGQPNGIYCAIVTDATGCQANDCRNVQPPCSLTATVTNAGTTMTATITNCTGSPNYQWQKFTGVWTNIGTNTNTYNHSGTEGDYRVIVTCTGCTTIANYTYIAPCSLVVTMTVNTTTLVGNTTGCAGSRTWTWLRFDAGSWVQVAQTSNSSTSNTYTPTLTGLYRVEVICGNCYNFAQANWTAPNPCNGFSTTITGTFTGLCIGTAYAYNTTQTGGTAPFTKQWYWNGVLTGVTTNGYSYTPSSSGSNTLACKVTDANGCNYTDTKILTSQQCCGMSLVIAPTSVSKCTNESATFTATPTGGSSPYTYIWTSTLTGNPPVNQGGTNTKTLAFATAGTYAINGVVTDNVGCQASANSTMTVTTCTNCVCTPSLALVGCQLNGSFTGGGCPNFSYQLQYSATGSGWTSVASGTANANFSYTPTANGYYRLVIFGTGCTAQESSTINVTCYVATCSNQPTITLNGVSSETCGSTAVTVTGNSFGGSATSVTIIENGAGSVTPTSTTTTPFSFTYTPTAADIGTTVTITFTTNNPLGSPCSPQVRTYAIIVKALPTAIISSSNANLCVGSTRTLTGNPTGGIFTASANGSVTNGVLTAVTAGSITVNYTATSNGCSSSTAQTITAVSIPPAPIVTSSCNNGVGTLTVTSPTGAAFTYSLSGGAYQSSTIFTNVANGSHTIYVKNTDNCINAVTASISCQSCTCSASIAANASCLLTLTQSCAGYSWIWEQSNDGSTGWTTVATSGTTYQGSTGKYYRVTLSKASCTNVVTNIVQTSCACQGFTIDISTLPGRLTFGTLKFNGNNLTNYRIQWKKCSDNSIVFESGMGTGAGSGVYSHPFANLPLTQGCYYPFILTSDQGNNLDCFADINVTNWTCPEPPTYSYEGPGGAASTREFAMDINPSTTHVKIESFVTFTVPDNLEVIYNGVTLYNSSNVIASNSPVYVPITYTVSDPDVLFRITNQTPAQTTKWSIGNISCCSGLQPCPTLSDVPSVTSVTVSTNSNCNCLFTPIFSNFSNTCRNCHHAIGSYGIGGCIYSGQNNSTCLGNGNIVVNKPNNTTRVIDFDNSTMYTAWKSYVQGVTNIDYRINVQFQSVDCGNDGSLYSLMFFPNRSTITWDDVNFTQTIVISASNPYTNNCTAANCSNAYYTEYQTVVNQFANTTAVGTHRSIKLRQIQWYLPITANQNTPFTSSIACTTYPCTTNLEKKYNIFLRNINCPCQSWQLFYDADNNGSYETLIQEAVGWTGTCN